MDRLRGSVTQEHYDRDIFNTFQTYQNHWTQDIEQKLPRDNNTAFAQIESEIQKEDNEGFPTSFKTYSMKFVITAIRQYFEYLSDANRRSQSLW